MIWLPTLFMGWCCGKCTSYDV